MTNYIAEYDAFTAQIVTNEGSGRVSFEWKHPSDRGRGGSRLRAAIDTLESLILAHATAGIRIDSPQYVEGVNTTIEAIFNEYDRPERKPESAKRIHSSKAT
jgi:hypothetical protein